VEFGQRLVHAPELRPENSLHAGRVERRERTLNVGGEGGGDSERFDAAAMTLGLEQACHQLVPVVERRPGAIQVEARRVDFAA